MPRESSCWVWCCVCCWGQGAKEFTLDLDNLELAPYIRADSVKITTEAKGKRPNNDTTVEVSIVLTLEAIVL